MEGCIFCKIINKELPSTIVQEDNNFIAFENIEPVSTYHYLICPKVHTNTFLDIKSDINMNLMIEFVQRIINNQKMSEGYKIVINGGKYQSVPHIHLHLLAGKLENEDDILNKT